MDLTFVLGELRSELETIDEAIVSLEKLAEVRKRRAKAQDAETSSTPSPKPARGKRASAGERVPAESKN